MYFIGVDWGATKTKLGLVDRRGALLDRREFHTHQGDPKTAIETLALQVEAIMPKKLAALGLGFCGMVDADKGRVIETTATLPGWRGFPLASVISKRLGLPCKIDNDANAAALGESRYGAGRSAHTFVMITLGSGVGGGVVIDSRVHRGAGSMAGKLGHIKVGGRRRCACGALGCLEAYASQWGFKRRSGKLAKEVFERAKAGEPKMQRVIDDAAWALGLAFSDIAVTLNPEVIAVGGGLSKSFGQLKPKLIEVFKENTLPAARRSTKIIKAKLGENAGIIGAAALNFG